MNKIVQCLGLEGREVVSISGCGGKTTLLWRLAGHFRAERVLASTTTKIGSPPKTLYDSLTDARELERLLEPPAPVAPGVHVAGTLYEVEEYIKSLPLSDLEALLPSFDKVLLECDGSRGLPVKGWARHEPVIPDFTTVSACLATIWAEGRPLDGRIVHRPEIFCRISGAAPGEPLSLRHMAAALAHPESMLAQSHGRKILLINQLDEAESMRKAEELLSLFPNEFLQGLDRVVGGSITTGKAEILWKN